MSASFSEDDTASLRVGQGATMTLNALPDAPFNASVASIASTGTSSNGTVSYAVYPQPQEPAGRRQGRPVRQRLGHHQGGDGALYVPSTAVTTAGGVSTVTVVKGSTKTRTAGHPRRGR